MAAALRYLQIFTTRASCMVRSHLLQLHLAAPEADRQAGTGSWQLLLMSQNPSIYPSIHLSRITMWWVFLLCDRMRPGPQLKTRRSLPLSQAPMILWLQPLHLHISPPFTPTHPVWLAGDQSDTMWWFHGSLSDPSFTVGVYTHVLCLHEVWFTGTCSGTLDLSRCDLYRSDGCKSDINYVHCRWFLEGFMNLSK